MTHGNYTIGRDWAEVPESVSSMLFQAAADAGVILTQDQEA